MKTAKYLQIHAKWPTQQGANNTDGVKVGEKYRSQSDMPKTSQSFRVNTSLFDRSAHLT